MAQIREIKKRIKAVGNIKRITNTMQMIATARFKTAMDLATASKPYTEKVRALVEEVSAHAGDVSHPLFQAPDPATNREIVLVLSSNRGLCGGYNSSVLRTSVEYLRKTNETERLLEVVGKKGSAFFKFAGYDLSHFHTQFDDKPSYTDVEQLAERYMAEFVNGEIDKISIAHMKFISTGRQRPVVEQLLPLEPPAADQSESTDNGTSTSIIYDFSPDAESLLSELLPVTVKTSLYQAFNDANVSEQVARMVAMKAATDNAGKLGKTLKRQFNRARQTQITTELTEIIGGAASLE